MTPTPDDIRKAREIVAPLLIYLGADHSRLETAIAQALAEEREAERERCGWRNTIAEEMPEAGRKIVVLYVDGSGSFLAYTYDGGMLDADGADIGDLRPEDHGLWAYLPDNYRLWCEDRSDDPCTLPIRRSEP